MVLLSASAVAGFGGSLEQISAKMDAAASSFQTMTAKIQKISHTAVINDNSEESGTIRMERKRPGEVRMRIELTEPDVKSIAFQGKKAEIYYPKINTVHEYDLGKHGALLDQFLLLGFGTSSKDLVKNYSVKRLGEEMVAGQPTVRLELTPKSSKVREHMTKVELWISETGGYPLRQKFYQPSGDYNVITYTDLKLNTGLADGALSLKLPSDVKREYPQK